MFSTVVLILSMALDDGSYVRSPAFSFNSIQECESRAHKVERDWFDKPHIKDIHWVCHIVKEEVDEK